MTLDTHLLRVLPALGCSIEWMKEPAKQDRLLDWLDNNPVERACLFLEPGKPSSLSRTKCAIKAAQYVFHNDENPKNGAGVMAQPVPFAASIIKLISRGSVGLISHSSLTYLYEQELAAGKPGMKRSTKP